MATPPVLPSQCAPLSLTRPLSPRMSGGQITYDAAISTLSSMFPHLDRVILETILENNRERGSMRARALLCWPSLELPSQSSQLPPLALSSAASYCPPAWPWEISLQPARQLVSCLFPPSPSHFPCAPAPPSPGGAMEPTVESLLALDQDFRPPPAAVATPPPSSSSSSSSSPAGRWRKPLPADFLMLPPAVTAITGMPAGSSEALSAQVLADQQLAEILQSEWALEGGCDSCCPGSPPPTHTLC